MKTIYRSIPVTLAMIASTAHAASVSDLYISEVMANPGAVADTAGEWFELYNPTTEAISLTGITVSDDGSNSFTIGTASITSGQYFVLARNGDTASNGGFTADYVYSNFSLNNSTDQIVLSFNATELLRLDYASAGFAAAGRSMELTGLPMTDANYSLTDSLLSYGLGDIGTPGAAGTFTPPATVPLPAAAWLFGSGLAGLIGVSRQRKKVK